MFQILSKWTNLNCNGHLQLCKISQSSGIYHVVMWTRSLSPAAWADSAWSFEPSQSTDWNMQGVVLSREENNASHSSWLLEDVDRLLNSMQSSTFCHDVLAYTAWMPRAVMSPGKEISQNYRYKSPALKLDNKLLFFGHWNLENVFILSLSTRISDQSGMSLSFHTWKIWLDYG